MSANKQVKVLRRRLAMLNDGIAQGLNRGRAEAIALEWALDYLEPIAEVEQNDVFMGGRNAAWKHAVAEIFGPDAVNRCRDWIAQDRLARANEQF